MSNMKARELLRQRIVYEQNRFAELVLWELPKASKASSHSFKYRLAYVVDRRCVLRYDNEAGKGDHCHWNEEEKAYFFSTPERLIADFLADIKRWNDENSDS
jgi:hypothetical protein